MYKKASSLSVVADWWKNLSPQAKRDILITTGTTIGGAGVGGAMYGTKGALIGGAASGAFGLGASRAVPLILKLLEQTPTKKYNVLNPNATTPVSSAAEIIYGGSAKDKSEANYMLNQGITNLIGSGSMGL